MIYVYPAAAIDPNITPTKVGQVWVNTATGHVWISSGTSSSADWSDVSAAGGSVTFSATDKVLGRATAGAGAAEEIACTAAGRALIDDADATAQRATLGLGSLATLSAAPAGTLTGATLASGVTASSITSFGANPVLGVASATSLNLGSSVFSQLSSNHVAISNGASAQSLSVYNVAGTDYERGVIGWQTTSNVLTIGTQKGGAGVARDVSVVVGGAQRISVSTSQTTLSGITFMDYARFSGGGIYLDSSNRGVIANPSDGVFSFYNWNQNSLDRIQYGGTTSSFPATKRRNATLETRLADDSAIAVHIHAIFTKAGAISDADFTNPVDGCEGYDTTNFKHYVRSGGTWRSSAAYT